MSNDRHRFPETCQPKQQAGQSTNDLVTFLTLCWIHARVSGNVGYMPGVVVMLDTCRGSGNVGYMPGVVVMLDTCQG